MLVVDGFFENGVFIPEKPLISITGRQRAVLNKDYIGETADAAIRSRTISPIIWAGNLFVDIEQLIM